jgi:hypothetical protein
MARELGALGAHPNFKILDKGCDLFHAHGQALCRRQAIDRPLSLEDRIKSQVVVLNGLQIGNVGLLKLIGSGGLVLGLIGRLHDDEGRAGDLSLTEISGLFGPARSPTAQYVALIPHSPFNYAQARL